MPVLNGIKCPVCNNEFNDSDDVVYCPDCGTPHHRECYKLAGHCVNAGLHQTGFVFNEGSPAKAQQNPAVQADNTNNKTFAAPQGEAANQNQPPFFQMPNVQMPDYFAKFEGETIDGDNAKFYAASVNTNIDRFMKLFKKFDGKKGALGWNWGAFFFGPYYLLFRKMYTQGIGFLVIQTLISYLGSFFMTTKAPNFMKAVNALITSKANGTFRAMTVTQADFESLRSASDYQMALNVAMIMFAALVVVRIFIALFADKMYFSVVKNRVKTVSEKLDSGETISMINFGNAPAELTGEKAKLFYLSRRGGTSIIPALLAYLVINIVSSL